MTSRVRRYAALIALAVLLLGVIVVIVMRLSRSPEPTMSSPEISGFDEIDDVPMFNRLTRTIGNCRIEVWTNGHVLLGPTSSVDFILDIISQDGSQPVRRLELTGSDSLGHEWRAEIDVTMADPTAYTLRSGNILLRFRFTNPLTRRFAMELHARPGERNEASVDVRVRRIGSDESLELGRMTFRAARR
jgi:hypothetical protein